jgi:hypothetical protein
LNIDCLFSAAPLSTYFGELVNYFGWNASALGIWYAPSMSLTNLFLVPFYTARIILACGALNQM